MATDSHNQITLASRDSLLAMAQTIETARRLKRAGFAPVIRSLKTAGDLKLDAALYTVAAQTPQKEGRAFFTKELDEALLGGRADAAVHSFKDLPYEKVPGIGEPILFSQEIGNDLLIIRRGTRYGADGAGLIIGTSSLRRIHQLQIVLPEAKTVVLRGNVVTRLKKLEAADRDINAILIAGAGLRRLEKFTSSPVDYATFIGADSLAHLEAEIARFRTVDFSAFTILELPEQDFPTAPGQGVLAFQLSDAATARAGSALNSVFPEHAEISARVGIERQVMRSLQTGCHAPLGVSAQPLQSGKVFSVHVCFSRDSSADPVFFRDSLHLTRRISGETARLVQEIRKPTNAIFWWGSAPTTLPEGLSVTLVPAFSQVMLPATAPDEDIAAVFLASEAVLPYFTQHAALHALPVWCAGKDTAARAQKTLPNIKPNIAAEKGFAAALTDMRNRISGKILWLGSGTGLARAQKTGNGDTAIRYLPVYDNEPNTAHEIIARVPQLADKNLIKETLHAVTSSASAQAFADYVRANGAPALQVSCFGKSALELLQTHGIDAYHLSTAATFAEYIDEITGSTRTMKVHLPVGENA